MGLPRVRPSYPPILAELCELIYGNKWIGLTNNCLCVLGSGGRVLTPAECSYLLHKKIQGGGGEQGRTQGSTRGRLTI